MAVKIRLLRMGKIRNPQYRIVVADSRTKRDGRAIEYIGIYHPKENPSLIEVKSDRVQHWLTVGAQPSEPVQRILEKTGDWQKFKGLPAPPPLLVSEKKASQQERYEAEAKAAAGIEDKPAPAKKAPAKKAEPKAAEPKAEPKADAKADAPAEAEPKGEVKAESTRAEPKSDAPTQAAAETRDEAAAKAEDPAGAGAGDAN